MGDRIVWDSNGKGSSVDKGTSPVCQHGSLRRQCLVCELQQEVERLKEHNRLLLAVAEEVIAAWKSDWKKKDCWSAVLKSMYAAKAGGAMP